MSIAITKEHCAERAAAHSDEDNRKMVCVLGRVYNAASYRFHRASSAYWDFEAHERMIECVTTLEAIAEHLGEDWTLEDWRGRAQR